MQILGSEADLGEQAATAQAAGDWSAAAMLAAELRERFPSNKAGFHLGAVAARDLRLFDEASAILAEATARFGNDLWAVAEQARVALARGDREETRRLAAELRKQFPQQEAGYHLGALAARDLQLFDEASAILAEAADRFANDLWVATEQARVAHGRGDKAETQRLAAGMRSRFPDDASGYLLGATAARDLRLFDEASAILAEAADRFANDLWVATEQARVAHGRGDKAETRRLATDMRSRFPDDVSGYHLGAVAARDLRLFDEASAILAEAAERFANDLWLATEQARVAHGRGDKEETRRLAANIRNRFPDDVSGYHLGSAAARELRLFDEANAILTEATSRFANDLWLATEQAQIAYAGAQVAQARRLAANLRSRFPDDASGYLLGATAARDLRLFDEASAILTQAAAVRFADEIWMATELALLAHACGDAEQAIERLAALRAREPAHPSGYRMAVTLLRGVNRTAEARAVLDAAESRFSSEGWFVRQSEELSNLSSLAANRADAERLIKTLSAGQRAAPSADRDKAQMFDKLVVVVGMHRAGTSLCAKIVEGLGFSLGGPLLRPMYDNPDGFQEHEEIQQSHEALLAYLGATWDTSWLVRGSIKHHLQCAEVRQIMARLKSIVVKELRASGGRWAFKDPRTASFLPLWSRIFEELGIEPIWVLAVRDPTAVAASLYARNRLPPDVGELLWVEHYLNALRHLGPRIAGIIHYENWFLSDHDQLDRLANILGPISACDTARASASINVSLRRSMPQLNDTALSITGDLYSWLRADHVSLGLLQARADLAWTKLRAHAAVTADANARMKPDIRLPRLTGAMI